jgi:predicted amidophosphoribosyltransferase
LADVLRRAKFRPDESAAVFLGELLQRDERALALAAGVVTPVPLSPARMRARGYNQAGVIARKLAQAAGWPVAHLRRRSNDRAQSLRGATARRIVGVFAARHAPAIVTLVDDVVTTGQTVVDAARALREAGAEEVRVVAVLRSMSLT